MKEESNVDSNNMDQFTEFSGLLSLRVEGQATLNHFLLFPLHRLRYLHIKAEMDSDGILKVVHQSQGLEVLTLDYTSHDSVDGLLHENLPTQGVRFPPVMLISTNDPEELMPHLCAAESMSTDVRLTISCSESCSTDVRNLFSRNAHWLLKVLS